MAKEIFVNLPVKDLNRSIEFFTKLGFTFNPKFTDEDATCMIIGENIFSMLITEKLFSKFTKKPISDASKATEEVNEMVEAAISAGGVEYSEPQDHGWMFYRAFEDLDHHQWEVMYGDESQFTKKK